MNNIAKICVCTEKKPMLRGHMQELYIKIWVFTCCEILTIKIEIQKIPFYPFFSLEILMITTNTRVDEFDINFNS